MITKILQFLLNTILISIPEEAFIVAFTLIIVGKGKSLTVKINDVLKFSMPVVTVAAISSFLRNILEIKYEFMPFLSICLLATLIILSYKIKDAKSILICFSASIISFIAVGLIQFLYVPLILSYSNITMHQLNTFSWILFLCSLPERIIEVTIIALLITKTRSVVKVNPFKILGNNKGLIFIFLANVFLILTFVYAMTKSIYSYNIFVNLPNSLKIIISLLIIIIPLCSLGGMVFIVYLISYKEAIKQLYIVEETKVMNALIGVLSDNNEYKEIKNEVKEFESQILSLHMPGIKLKNKKRRVLHD